MSARTASASRIAHRYLIRTSMDRRANQLVSAFSERKASVLSRIRELGNILTKFPKAWEIIRRVLGISSIQDIKSIAASAKSVLRKILTRLRETFPLNLFFDGKRKMPSLTEILAKIAKRSPTLDKVMKGVKAGADWIDRMLKKHLPTLSKPLLAAIFIYVWVNVTEISWDLEGILKGFMGQVSLSELFGSLPESGIGALISLTGVGTFYFVPISIVARISWLVANHYITWENGSVIVHWEKMGVNLPDEIAIV